MNTSEQNIFITILILWLFILTNINLHDMETRLTSKIEMCNK